MRGGLESGACRRTSSRESLDVASVLPVAAEMTSRVDREAVRGEVEDGFGVVEEDAGADGAVGGGKGNELHEAILRDWLRQMQQVSAASRQASQQVSDRTLQDGSQLLMRRSSRRRC